MRLLILDHHFRHDIDALRAAAEENRELDVFELDVLPYQTLRDEALSVLPERVADGLRAFADPDLREARRRYAAVLREILEDRFTDRPFDAFVVPSDTFFYVRAAPAILHSFGVPFLVAQKETTISEHTMREHALQLRRFAPPVADRMTVCSERHRQFWLRAGGSEERIVVTGQPRFDYYQQPQLWPRRLPFGGDDQPSVLFLSYAVDAYHPQEGTGSPAWASLHRETELGLTELARQGWQVLIKPHPQQQLGILRAWRERERELWGQRLHLVDPGEDVRGLITAADVVVGFQSTALLEAMLAGRPVLYTGWDPLANRLGEQLIPFSHWHPEITVVREARALPAAIARARGSDCPPDALRRRREIAERYLGPLDGRAARRTLSELTGAAAGWAAARGTAEETRREWLANRHSPIRLARRRRAFARAIKRRFLALATRAVGARS